MMPPAPKSHRDFDPPFDFASRDEWSARLFHVAGHSLRIITHADDRLEAVIRLIDHAQSSIRAYYYTITNDKVGELFANALRRAAARGVSVTLGYDNFGSNETPAAWFDALRADGINVFCFSSRRSVRYLIRNHQKMLIVDDTALIGGFNINASYFDFHDVRCWQDIGLLLNGPKTAELAQYFDELLAIAGDGETRLREVRWLTRRWQSKDGPLQWVWGGPTARLSPWAFKLKHDLEGARNADIVTAYFSPGRSLTRRLSNIAKRGGRLRLVLAGKSDNHTTIEASRLLYPHFLKKGATLFEFRPRRLHMKLLLVDDIIYIGSANMDPRSLFINLEMMLRIESPDMAHMLRAYIDGLAKESEVQTWGMVQARRTPLGLLKQAFAYLIVVIVDYTVSRKIGFWERTKQRLRR